MKTMETTVLFRPSEISNLMASARGESNRQKYDKMVVTLEEKQDEWMNLKNKETKKADALQERIIKLQNQIHAAEAMKDLPHLSEGTKKHLRKKMIEIKWGRYKDIQTKYMTKGKDCEEKAIDIYSQIKGMVFENNKERVKNDIYSGEIDLPWYNKKGEMVAISDIKNSWDIHTFYDNEDTIKTANKWQGVAYMDLHPTVEKYHIANILVDNTHDAILNELYRESYQWKDQETPTWRELQVIKSHIYTKAEFDRFIHLRGCTPTTDEDQKVYDSFVEMPIEERMIEHTFIREEVADDIQKARTRMEECRVYLEMIYGIKHIPA